MGDAEENGEVGKDGEEEDDDEEAEDNEDEDEEASASASAALKAESADPGGCVGGSRIDTRTVLE